MIVVRCSEDNYIYDIHSLVKAFYPAEEVKAFREGEKELNSDDGLPEFYVYMGVNEIKIQVFDRSNDITSNREMTSGAVNISDRVSYKNELKRCLYSILSEVTGKQLPWGSLTGIRPTKIAMNKISEGMSDEDVLTYMKDTYFCSDAKAILAVNIAHYEKRILSEIDYDNGYSLYIGIPFCPSTCLYCSFTSYPIAMYEKIVDEYLGALKKEIDYVAENMSDKVLDTVYIGGGTPTTLTAEQLEELISYLKSKINLENIKEFTVEAGRADSITEQKLEVLYRMGVTRISVNPQTMNEETLRIIGRKATAAATVEAYKLARKVGFDNINMDLIVGLPNESIDDVSDTLKRVKELAPDSITVHSLAIKRASRLAQVIDEMGYETINNSDDIMTLAQDVASDLGMSPYYLYRQKNMSGNFENVGYATEGKAGIYNILIMEEVQSIVALGAGTVTKRVYGDGRIERCDNVKDVTLYISKIDEMIDRKRELFKD
ncbi:MAG: coproporphyrinogen dehydrogenase HemZ [Lachnospiraceae bacterium]|nr:coproporphyrinogen dehydrogenase HemZ [Candidatus Colinaster equi]